MTPSDGRLEKEGLLNPKRKPLAIRGMARATEPWEELRQSFGP